MSITRDEVVAAYKALKDKGLDPVKDFTNEEVAKASDLYDKYFNSLAKDVSGREALELNQNGSYDLVLIDAGLGDEDSFEAALDFLEQDLEQAKTMNDESLVQQIESKIAEVKQQSEA